VYRFLLVSLNIDAILGEVTIRQRMKLEEMTQGAGLSDAYTATLARLKAQKGYKSVLGMKVLMWVVYSEWPLGAAELCHALGVETGAADLDPENAPALRTVLSSCLGLVTVKASSSTVRPVHFTLQEHLSRDATLFHSPHSKIAEVCLTYLNFEHIRDLPPTLCSAPATTPLLEYASVYWGTHARKGMTENIKMLALKLFDNFDEHISAQLLLLHYNRDRGGGPYFDGEGGPIGFAGLHGVSFLGIEWIVSTILEMKEWVLSACDCMGMTALTWAARNGHEKKMPTERKDICTPIPDSMNQTPQRLPLSEDHDGVARTVREEANLNRAAPDCGCQTSLSLTPVPRDQFAAEKPFRSHDPNSNMANIDGQRAPLPVAHNEPPGSPDLGDSIPESAQSHRRSHRLFSIWPLKV